MLQAVLQPGVSDNPAKFEETWKSWEHQVDVYENLSSSKLDDHVKISVVLGEAPQKLRDHLLVNSQQFESNNNKLRAIIQAYLNTNKTWIVTDVRETDPMEVDCIGRGKSKSKGNRKGSSKDRSKEGKRARAKTAKARATAKATAKAAEKPDNDKECSVCGRKDHFARDCWSRQEGERGRSRERQCRVWKRIRVHG